MPQYTFLFTDIEGSTRLLQHLGDRYEVLIARHHEVLREVWARHGGRVVDTQGDAFFVAFSDPGTATRAALDAQRTLVSQSWPGGAELRVRMGLHTGGAAETSTGFVGLTVHEAARIASAGHGGQVLLSRTTADAVRPQLPAGASLVDLGEHRLKHLQSPAWIFQLAHADLEADFPELKSLSARPNNLPLNLSSFVGRERELAELADLVAMQRLVTLTGPGGGGKTRLGVQLAAGLLDDYPNGVWLSELASIEDPALVPLGVAVALKLREEPGRAIDETLRDYLSTRRALIVLDNCEHVVEAAAHLADGLIRTCPELKIVATSREPLRVPGEAAWPVPTLHVPDVPGRAADAQDAASVRLFVDRARHANPRFGLTDENAGAVVEVCRRLDGIPLAIELAAARVRVLSPDQILARLEDRFRLLTGGSRTVLPRQQTLVAALTWSYDLLPDEDKDLFECLSVFRGGFGLEAAEAVAGAEGDVLDGVTSLVEKSLVQPDEGRRERYRMLESIRELAEHKLSARSGADDVAIRHLDWCAALASRASAELIGPRQGEWLDIVEVEHDNIRAALANSLRLDRLEQGTVIANDLVEFWSARGHWSEPKRFLEGALGSGTLAPLLRARAHRVASVLAFAQSDVDAARAHCEQGLRLSTDADDAEGMGSALNNLGNIAAVRGDFAEAERLYTESLVHRRRAGDERGIAVTIGNLANIALEQDNYERAISLQEESLAIRRRLGDERGAAMALGNLGSLHRTLGDLERARLIYEELLPLTRKLGDVARLAFTLGELGKIALHLGHLDDAEAAHREALTLCRDAGDRAGEAQCLTDMAELHRALGDADGGIRGHSEALAIRRELGLKRAVGQSLELLANLKMLRGALDQARELLRESLEIGTQIGDRGGCAHSLRLLGLAEMRAGDFVLARQRVEQAAAIHAELGNRPGLAQAVGSLSAIAYLEGKLTESSLHAERLRQIGEELGDRRLVADALNDLAAIAMERGDATRSRRLNEEALLIRREQKNLGGIADSTDNLGLLARAEGRLEDAEALHREAREIYRRAGTEAGAAVAGAHLAVVLAMRGNVDHALESAAEASTLIDREGNPAPAVEVLGALAEAAAAAGDRETSLRARCEALELISRIGLVVALPAHLESAAAIVSPDAAASICGAADALRERMTMVRLHDPQRERERVESNARSSVDDDAWQRAYERGATMDAAAAVAYALAELDTLR